MFRLQELRDAHSPGASRSVCKRETHLLLES